MAGAHTSGHHFGCPLAAGAVDVEVRHEAHEGAAHRVHQHAARLQPLADFRCRHAGAGHIENHDIGLDLVRDRDAVNPRQRLREKPRVLVVLAESRRMLLERNQSRRREHTGLAHAAAQPLAIESPARHRLGASDQQGPDRRAQTLRQAEHHCIGFRGNFVHRTVQMRRRVENPRAVQMHLEPALMRAVADLVEHFGRIHRAARQIVRVLEFDESRGRAMRAKWDGSQSRICRHVRMPLPVWIGRATQPENQAIIESS